MPDTMMVEMMEEVDEEEEMAAPTVGALPPLAASPGVSLAQELPGSLCPEHGHGFVARGMSRAP